MLAASLTIAAPPALGKPLPRNSINSKQIKNRQVKTTDLAKGAVRRPDIAINAVDGTTVLDGALSGFDVADDSLKGRQVEETSLDFNVLQARLSGGCSSGEAIRSVSALGQPTCVDASGGGFDTPLGGDLTGTLPNPLIALGAVNTAKLADDAVTAAKVPLNELGGTDILESSLGMVPNADQIDGMNSTDFVGAAATAGGDLGGTFSNLQLGAGSVGTSEVDSSLTASDIADTSTLGGPEINESNLGIVPNADTLDGINSTGFVDTAAAAGGDLGGTFSNLQLGAGSVGTSEVDSSLTAADIADTSTIGGPEINESNLSGLIQGAGQVVRPPSLNATGATGAGTDVLTDVPGFGTSDIELSACTPDVALPVAALQFNNSSGTNVLVWEFGPISAVLGNTSVSSGAQEVLGSAVAGVLNSDELLDIYLYRVDTGASARVTIGEASDATNCRFVVEAVTSA